MPREGNRFDKRHLVLYAVMGLALLVILGLKISGYPVRVSYTTPDSPAASSTIEFATTTTVSTAATSTTAVTPALQFKLEVVTDEKTQERGLGGRATIPENYGMLFVFPKKQVYGFWMKDMLTPIDIVWVSDTGTIVGIEDSVSPATYPGVFDSPEPVRFVLETRAGEMRRHGWSVGSRLPFTLP